MLIELKKKEFYKATPLFTYLRKYHLMIDSVIDGNTPGRIFIDDYNIPTTAFLWNSNYDSGWFLEGTNFTDEFCKDLNVILKEKIIPEGISLEKSVDCNLCYYPDNWEEKISIIFEGFLIRYDRRKHFVFYKLKNYNYTDLIPSNYQLIQIDQEFVTKADSYRNGERIIRDWDVFLPKEKFVGFCLINENVIVSLCTSDYISKDRIEFGIFTDEEYRKRGFATIIGSATVDYAQKNGYNWIGWHCWITNEASANTALAIGYELSLDHPVYHMWYNLYENLIVFALSPSYGEEVNLDNRIKYLKKALELLENKNKEALASKYFKSTERFKIYYRIAVSYAETKNKEETIFYLEKAIKNGFPEKKKLKNDAIINELLSENELIEIISRTES